MLGLKYLTCEVSKPNITKQNVRAKAPTSPLIRFSIDFCDCCFYSSERENICHPAPALLFPPFWFFLVLFRPLGVPPFTPQVPVTVSISFISMWQVHVSSGTPWKQFLYLYWPWGILDQASEYCQEWIHILPGLFTRCSLAETVFKWQISLPGPSCLGRQPGQTAGVNPHDGTSTFSGLSHSLVSLVFHTKKLCGFIYDFSSSLQKTGRGAGHCTTSCPVSNKMHVRIGIPKQICYYTEKSSVDQSYNSVISSLLTSPSSFPLPTYSLHKFP